MKDKVKTVIHAIEMRQRIAVRNQQAFVDLPHELVGDVVKLLKEKKPAEPEMEGGGSTWWMVCGECHGQIDEKDDYCRHCGRRILRNEKRE